jgi:hypothetical protein
MLRAAIDVLHAARDARDVQRQSRLLLPEVEQALASAEGLIDDVREIATSSEAPSRVPVAPEVILSAALLETLRAHLARDIRFTYDLRHTRSLHVDAKKVERVVTNIVANALQAMGRRGSIQFATRDSVVCSERMVELCIGNDGPAIPEADLPNLFDPFFTRNKPTGTGLGLAIAHRVVTAHGGTIRATSTPDRGVTFHFTLPAHDAPAVADVWLPAHSAELAPRGGWLSDEPPPSSDASGDLPQVAIVDDSRAFLAGWRASLEGAAEVHFFTSPEAFLARADDPTFVRHLVLVIIDYRFANSKQTGTTLAKTLRARAPKLPLFLSTSGYVAPDELTGAIDHVLDKGAMGWPALKSAIERFGPASAERRVAS